MRRFRGGVGSFPEEFDAAFYRSTYRDLSHMDGKQLLEHFETYGRGEGRVASPACRRKDFIELCTAVQSILEIGPFCNPALTGPNVSYFDVLSSDQLRERALAIGYPIRSVPNIDFIDPRGDLSVVDKKFLAAFSSHCIEHQPDFIHHLKQVESILVEGGLYFIIIPNKLYCFDHFISKSTIANVVDAYINSYRIHRLESVIEHRALVTHNDPLRHWRGDHADLGNIKSVEEKVLSAVNEYKRANGAYIDVHAWQFVPGSFREICEQLYNMDYINFRPIRVYDTPYGSNEFCSILELSR